MPLGDIPITQMSNNRSVHSVKRVNRFFYTNANIKTCSSPTQCSLRINKAGKMNTHNKI